MPVIWDFNYTDNGDYETKTNSPISKGKVSALSVPTSADGKAKGVRGKFLNNTGIILGGSILKQGFNYATSNVGKWTGNSQIQTMTNNATQAIGMGAGLAVSLATGNYLAAATMITSATVQLITKSIDYRYEDKWNTIKSQQAKVRAGYDANGAIIGGRK